MFYMRLFKNEHKEKDDNKPIYSNSNFTVKERVVLEPGQAYTIGMWKDKERESLNIKVDEKREKPQLRNTEPEDDIDVPY
jgi:hypothetical protein|tara:strand:- start:99 stop:338 length:240 start_codon:yes stop_codon:yes gene_type:complete